jgi:hypothetical protein
LAILVAVGKEIDEEFWTLQRASQEVGLTTEGIRLWTTGEQPRVRSKRVALGRRWRVLVNREDVLREAELVTPRKKPAPSAVHDGRPTADEELRDRVAILEEVVRRHRIINDQQEEIAERYREISRQHAEIEELLLAPSWVPNL